MHDRPLRLIVYDRTCAGRGLRPGLSDVWRSGTVLYRGLGRADAWHGAASWAEALDWLASVEPGAPIGEVQYWGHGKWGEALIDKEKLDIAALSTGHAHGERLRAVRERMLPGGRALWWWRTCETLGGDKGHAFARAWSRFFDCRVAGHTYIIAFWQSGLHLLRPGDEPHWPAGEGFDPTAPPGEPRALWSARAAPHTITCLGGAVPDGW